MSGLGYDLAIIGGGINGCSIARDAAGRGLSVFLCEQGDLGGATSSASTKLTHGDAGLLDRFAVGPTREALKERESLTSAAPHIVHPIRFVLPHHKRMRPRALLRAGLLARDYLGGGPVFPPTRTLKLASDPAGETLQDKYRTGFEYSDCWVDDARLVVLNAMDARTHGANINPGLRCVIAEREGRMWRLSLESSDNSDERFVVMARAVVNAAGPWAAEVLNHVIDGGRKTRVRLVKGSHIVVRKLFDDERAFVFQNADGRIVFAIPYEHDFTLIGTTEEDYHGDPGDVAADSAEIAYLTTSVSDFLRQPVYEDEIVWSYSGIRPVLDDGGASGREAKRGPVLDLDAADGRAPMLSVFGGSITTSRKRAEQAVDMVRPTHAARPWTDGAALPGGLFEVDGVPDLVRAVRAAYPFVDERLANRMVTTYGTLTQSILSGARQMEDLGRVIGADLTEAEARYLTVAEWAHSAEDILWRRTKLGLRFTPAEVVALEDWLGLERDRASGARIAQAGA